MTMTDTTYDPLAIAVDWARAGWHMVPVRHNPGGDDDKKPVMGKAWQERATNRLNEIVDYFTDAIMRYGAEGVSVGWAQGLDNCLTLDIDNKDEQRWPDFLAEVIDDGVRYDTPRGSHLYYRNPKGFQAGNGTSHLPEKVGFIDIRGAGGQVVVARPGHPPFDHHRLNHLQAFPRTEWLVPYGGVGVHASNQQVRDFVQAHTGQQFSESSWKGVLTMTNPDLWDHSQDGGASGRHNTAVGRMTKFMEEAALGLYDARQALELHKAWFLAIKPDAKPGEWLEMIPWAVGRALQKQDPPTNDSVETEPHEPFEDDGITLVNWYEFFTKERTDPEWLVQDLWPFGRHISIGSKAGQGKSELIQYVVSCLALGIDPWTRQERDPMRVVYLDMEMTDEDLYQRMTDFGYGVEHAEVLQDNLLYAVLPVMPALNSQAGLRFVERLVDRYTPDVFILDTFMKTLTGDENDAATVQEFTRLTGMLLKSRRIMSGRADHYGKNPDQGNRGTSAKDDDVDIAWRLERSGRYTTKLTATKRRQGFVPEKLYYERYHTADEGVRFLPRDGVIDNIPSQAVNDMIVTLDLLDIPLDLGRDRVKKCLADAGQKPGRNDDLSEAIRLRRERGPHLTVIEGGKDLSPNDDESGDRS